MAPCPEIDVESMSESRRKFNPHPSGAAQLVNIQKAVENGHRNSGFTH